MEENKKEYKTVEEYIELYPKEVQDKLQELRKVIKETAPEATEKISWRMPTFVLYGNLVHFAAFKKHIGFYPGASGIAQFQQRFADYKSSKGAVQFPIDEPIPFDLVREIVQFRVNENKREAEESKKKKDKKQ